MGHSKSLLIVFTFSSWEGMFCLNVCLCTMCMQYLQGPEEGVGFLGLEFEMDVEARHGLHFYPTKVREVE